MAHIPRYAFRPQARLAADAGVSRSAVSRFLSGESNPSFALAMAVIQALERHLGRRIDPRDIVGLGDDWPTPTACELCGCPGCLPQEAYTPDDRIRPEYRNLAPGRWSLGRSPTGEVILLPCSGGSESASHADRTGQSPPSNPTEPSLTQPNAS